jgi:hypothetical protein
MCLVLELWQTCGDAIAGAAHRHRSQVVNFLTNYLMLDACSQLEPQGTQRRGEVSSIAFYLTFFARFEER